MRDLIDTAILALVLGALVRTLRELHREREENIDDGWPKQRVQRDERQN